MLASDPSPNDHPVVCVSTISSTMEQQDVIADPAAVLRARYSVHLEYCWRKIYFAYCAILLHRILSDRGGHGYHIDECWIRAVLQYQEDDREEKEEAEQ